MAALVVNSIVGSGIFGLPSDLARLTGKASPWAVLLGGAAVGTVMACFAEVASYFDQAGGPYLYTRFTFGRLLGIQTGWMLWLVRVAAPAARLVSRRWLGLGGTFTLVRHAAQALPMIAFASSVTEPEVYEECAARGIERTRDLHH